MKLFLLPDDALSQFDHNWPSDFRDIPKRWKDNNPHQTNTSLEALAQVS